MRLDLWVRRWKFGRGAMRQEEEDRSGARVIDGGDDMVCGVRCIVGALLLLLCANASCYAQEMAIAQDKDSDLASLLNRMVVLAAPQPSMSKPLAYILKIIVVPSLGECDGSLESCPKEFVYVAISDIGEEPDMRLYRLPDSYRWDLVSDVDDPLGEPGPEVFVRFRMVKTVLPAGAKGFAKEIYEIRINNLRGFMRKLSP